MEVNKLEKAVTNVVATETGMRLGVECAAAAQVTAVWN